MKTFKTQTAAKKWATTIEADQIRGVGHDYTAGRERLADYAPRCLANKALKPTTTELYGDLLRRLILPEFGQAQIGKISQEAVREWRARTGREVTEMQAAKAYRLLKAILNTAESDGLIGRNPCQIQGAGLERSAERPLVTPEIILDLADAISPRLRALVLLAGFGGLRRGELFGLRRRDVDVAAGVVTIERQVTVSTRLGRIETTPKTSAGQRTVSLPAFVVESLEGHLHRWTGPGQDDAVFTGEKGSPLGPRSLYPAFDVAKRRVGIEGVTVHDLRHAAGTMAAQGGGTTRELMARLGHSSAAASLRYQHAASSRDQVIADHLDALIRATPRRSLADART